MSIDLGMKMGGMSEPIKMDSKEEYYPEFHYCGDKELGIPDEGVMEIRYKKVSSEERKDRDGKERYSCTIEVREILETEDEVEAPATSGEGGKTKAKTKICFVLTTSTTRRSK